MFPVRAAGEEEAAPGADESDANKDGGEEVKVTEANAAGEEGTAADAEQAEAKMDGARAAP